MLKRVNFVTVKATQCVSNNKLKKHTILSFCIVTYNFNNILHFTLQSQIFNNLNIIFLHILTYFR